MPVRIYEIAKKLNLESKFVLNKAKELGIAAAKVPSSTLDKITAEFLEEQLAPLAKPPEPPKPVEVAPVAIIHAPPPPAEPVVDAGPAAPAEVPATEFRAEPQPSLESVSQPVAVLPPESPSEPVVPSAPSPEPSPVAEAASVPAPAPQAEPPVAPSPFETTAPASLVPPAVQTGQLVGRIDLSQFGYGGRTTRGVSSPPPARP
ncbi:MAG: translation initiation factor IF-2 N-terminal domain-containing protein, partial [Verrucomicrobiota bacterium]